MYFRCYITPVKDMHVDYSLLICTYNPDERLLKRCLNAVCNLDRQGLEIEVLLIDNNSVTPIESLAYVRDFLSNEPFVKLLVVKEQGLTHARTAGILAAKGMHIVFFDDDNEPEKGYLQELKELNIAHKDVAAWGPGKITVDFIDGIETELEDYAEAAFQYRDNKHVTYANIRDWQTCYPFGTGLCVQRSLLNSYHEQVMSKRFSMEDRKGNKMSSGGDTQIVLFCVEEGYAAGVSPGLKLVHIIPGKRANFDYLKRLTYGTGVCYSTLMLELFPERKDAIKQAIPRNFKLFKKLAKGYLKSLRNKNNRKTLGFVNYVAGVTGNFLAVNQKIPGPLAWVIRKMKLE